MFASAACINISSSLSLNGICTEEESVFPAYLTCSSQMLIHDIVRYQWGFQPPCGGTCLLANSMWWT